mgnify:FL=1
MSMQILPKMITKSTQVIKPQNVEKATERIAQNVTHNSSATATKTAKKAKFRFFDFLLPKRMRRCSETQYFPNSRVKSLEKTTDGEGTLLRKVNYNQDGSLRRIETFNPESNLREILEHDSAGNLIESKMFGDTLHKKTIRNSKGEITYFEDYSSSSRVRTKRYYEGHKLESEFYLCDPGEANRYATRIEKIKDDGSKELIKKLEDGIEKIEYDTAGNMTLKTVENSKGKTILDKINGKTITETTYTGPNKILGGTKKFKKTIIVDAKKGTTTIIKDKHGNDGGLTTLKETTVLNSKGEEILFKDVNSTTGNPYYERITDPKTKTQTEKFYHNWTVKDGDYDPSNFLSKTRIKVDGVITREVEYNKNGKQIYRFKYDPKTKSSEKMVFRDKNRVEVTRTANGKSETRYYDKNANRINPDGSKYNYKNVGDEAKEWYHSNKSKNSSQRTNSNEKTSNKSQSKNSRKVDGPRPEEYIGNEKEFLNRISDYTSNSVTDFNAKELKYLADILGVKNPNILTKLGDKDNVEAKKVYRELCKKFHPDRNHSENADIIFKILANLHG